MRTARLAARIEEPVPLGAAWLRDHQLRFNKPGADGTGKANVIPAAGGTVWGVVFEIATCDLERLDHFEPCYVRRELIVHGAHQHLQAEAYVFEPPAPDLPPTGEYLAHLIAGAREHRLPADYAEALSQTALWLS